MGEHHTACPALRLAISGLTLCYAVRESFDSPLRWSNEGFTSEQRNGKADSGVIYLSSKVILQAVCLNTTRSQILVSWST